jgi:hypothetical protein
MSRWKHIKENWLWFLFLAVISTVPGFLFGYFVLGG